MSSSKKQSIPASPYEIFNTLLEIRYSWLKTPKGFDWLAKAMNSDSTEPLVYRLLEVIDDYPPQGKHQQEQIANAMDYAFTSLRDKITMNATKWAASHLDETYNNRRDPAWVPPWERDEMQEVRVTEVTEVTEVAEEETQ